MPGMATHSGSRDRVGLGPDRERGRGVWSRVEARHPCGTARHPYAPGPTGPDARSPRRPAARRPTTSRHRSGCVRSGRAHARSAARGGRPVDRPRIARARVRPRAMRCLPGGVPGGVPVQGAPLLPFITRAVAGGVDPVAGRVSARAGRASAGGSDAAGAGCRGARGAVAARDSARAPLAKSR